MRAKRAKIAFFTSFYAETVKFDLILTYLKLVRWANWEGNKIFCEKIPPCSLWPRHCRSETCSDDFRQICLVTDSTNAFSFYEVFLSTASSQDCPIGHCIAYLLKSTLKNKDAKNVHIFFKSKSTTR